ncbi:MAG: ABC transporter ATP-binding protein, partial [Betaproteobacteria bacterium]|nr:ABC transporter ATP-binding protein [Betaproteobacteria bacterium]
TAVNPEILLMDEVIGAADLAFTEKSNKRMREFMEQGKILVLSSHSLELLAEYCNRTIWMDHGQIREDGPTEAVVAHYKASVMGA